MSPDMQGTWEKETEPRESMWSEEELPSVTRSVLVWQLEVGPVDMGNAGSIYPRVVSWEDRALPHASTSTVV